MTSYYSKHVIFALEEGRVAHGERVLAHAGIQSFFKKSVFWDKLDYVEERRRKEWRVERRKKRRE